MRDHPDARPALVGLLGPRRSRQGLGPYLARFLERAGARVPAVAGRTHRGVAAATEELAASLGHGVQGYVGLEAMVAGERARGRPLDALVIASPTETHGPALEQGLEAGLHVLCEKPLVWQGEGSGARARRLVERFGDQGLLLAVNAQWPHVLPCYFDLFPDLRGAAVERFFMLLSPSASGPAAVPDALPHPLSLLGALLPDPRPRLEDPAVEIEEGPQGTQRISFQYVAWERRVSCLVELRHCPAPPRPAAFAVNGRMARREIELPDYSFWLAGGCARRTLPDPLELLVRDFVAALAAPVPPRADPRLFHHVAMLEEIMGAWPGGDAARS